MTAKEYLNQARHLDALINCRLREIDYWRDLSSSVSGSNFEPHYNPNKPTEAPFVRCLEKIDAIQKDVAEKVAYLVCLKETINAAIDRLASREEQLVLRYRYLDNCSWEEISRMLNVSLRTVHRIHGSALKIFLFRIESWHGLAQHGTLDLWYDYNSKVEYRTAFMGAIL